MHSKLAEERERQRVTRHAERERESIEVLVEVFSSSLWGVGEKEKESSQKKTFFEVRIVVYLDLLSPY